MKKITTFISAFILLNLCGLTVQAQSYCTSKGTNTTNGYIKKVSIETINNTSGNNGGYANFTAQSATLLKGATYTIELTPGFRTGGYQLAYWTVYIDYNHDGIFEPNEIVGEAHNYITVHKSFPVPSTALNGSTRMRIQMQANVQETNPCATFTYGEVEDYTVVLTTHIPRLAETDTDSKNAAAVNNFRLYPNPANDNLTVEFTGSSSGNANLNIYSLSGQKVMNSDRPYINGLNILNLNTSSFTEGFYILEIEKEGEIQYQRFIISR